MVFTCVALIHHFLASHSLFLWLCLLFSGLLLLAWMVPGGILPGRFFRCCGFRRRSCTRSGIGTLLFLAARSPAPLGPVQQKFRRAGRPAPLLAKPPPPVAKATDVLWGDDRHKGVGGIAGNLLGHQLGGVRFGPMELVLQSQHRDFPDVPAEVALAGDQEPADVVVENPRGGP